MESEKELEQLERKVDHLAKEARERGAARRGGNLLQSSWPQKCCYGVLE